MIISCNGTTAEYNVTCPIGTLTTKCMLSAVDLGVEWQQTDICEAVVSETSYTTCKCDLCKLQDRRRRRLESLDDLGDSVYSVFDLVGGFELMAMSENVFSDFIDVQKNFDEIFEYGVLYKTGVVNIFYAAIISFFLIFIIAEYYNHYRKHKIEQISPAIKQTSTVTPDTNIKSSGEALFDFLDSTMLGVFSGDNPKVRLTKEIVNNHLLFSIFTQQSFELRLVSLYEFLSLVNLTLFFVAIFCNLETQRDDGTCSGFTDSKTCLENSSIFDVDNTMCSWSDISQFCDYNIPILSIYSMVIIVFLTMVIIFPMRALLTFTFTVFRAPTIDSIQKERNLFDSTRQSLSRGISSIGQRETSIDNDFGQSIFVKNTISKAIIVPESVKRNRHTMVNFYCPVDIEKGEPISSIVKMLNYHDNKEQETAMKFSFDSRIQNIASTDITPQIVALNLLHMLLERKSNIKSLPNEIDFLEQWTLDADYGRENKSRLVDRMKVDIEMARNLYDDMKIQSDISQGVMLLRIFIWDLLGSSKT